MVAASLRYCMPEGRVQFPCPPPDREKFLPLVPRSRLKDTTVDLLVERTSSHPSESDQSFVQSTHCTLRLPQASDNDIKPRKGCNVHGEWTWEFRNQNIEPNATSSPIIQMPLPLYKTSPAHPETPEDEMRTKNFHVRDELVNSTTCKIRYFCTIEYSEDHRYTRGSLTSLRSPVPSLLSRPQNHSNLHVDIDPCSQDPGNPPACRIFVPV
jgi:hypothetical protein